MSEQVEFDNYILACLTGVPYSICKPKRHITVCGAEAFQSMAIPLGNFDRKRYIAAMPQFQIYC